MPSYLKPLCKLAPYAALALLAIFELIDTPIMIVLLVVLVTTGGRSCLPRSA